MIKGIKKIGLVAAIVTGLTLGGLTPNYSSKGLESKIPTVGMSVAEAKTTNPDGYEVPDLTGLEPHTKGYLKKAPEVLIEVFYTPNGGSVGRFSMNGKIFGYLIDHDRVSPGDYYLVDRNGDGKFETKYDDPNEKWDTPEWVKS